MRKERKHYTAEEKVDRLVNCDAGEQCGGIQKGLLIFVFQSHGSKGKEYLSGTSLRISRPTVCA